MGDDPKKAQRQKNLAMLAVLIALILLVYAITIMKISHAS